jgi:hypothetical protein
LFSLEGFGSLDSTRILKSLVSPGPSSSCYWATTIPSLKVISRHNPSQANATTDQGSSRNTTITLCEVVKFRKRSGKSRFEEKNAANKLQPNTVAERTQESPKEATLSTCCRIHGISPSTTTSRMFRSIRRSLPQAVSTFSLFYARVICVMSLPRIRSNRSSCKRKHPVARCSLAD